MLSYVITICQHFFLFFFSVVLSHVLLFHVLLTGIILSHVITWVKHFFWKIIKFSFLSLYSKNQKHYCRWLYWRWDVVWCNCVKCTGAALCDMKCTDVVWGVLRCANSAWSKLRCAWSRLRCAEQIAKDKTYKTYNFSML